jgi:hypothetical protein
MLIMGVIFIQVVNISVHSAIALTSLILGYEAHPRTPEWYSIVLAVLWWVSIIITARRS